MQDIILLKPVLLEKMWGGQKLKTDFGYDIPSDHTGECWAISAHPHGPATVANGPYQGLTLAELWNQQPQLFGGHPKGAVFPLLVKILDAAKDLSVQVHPDDEYALEHEGELGKTECWYVLSAEPSSRLIYGHTAKSKAEFKQLVEQGKWDQLLVEMPVKAGDFFYVPSDTVHAVGAGITVLEIQQSSDTTYRLYDWDRKDAKTGQKRALHVKKALDCCSVPFQAPKLETKKFKVGDVAVEELITTKFFTVQHWELANGSGTFTNENHDYWLVSVIAGTGEIKIGKTVHQIKKGTHFIITAPVNTWMLSGNLEIMVAKAN